jgi:PAS domain S-box-containing protein
MLKDFAKTSPVTFFALPVIIVGLLILSYFLYSTLLNNQIDARSKYLDRQLGITIEKVHEQVSQFRNEVPFLSQVDDFSSVFDREGVDGGKLRFRLKRVVNRYSEFVDTIFIYSPNEVYYLGLGDRQNMEEGFSDIESVSFPLQFTHVSKIIHVYGNKSMLIMPITGANGGKEIYMAALIDVYNLMKQESSHQFIGEMGYKVIFSENMGFRLAERGSQVDVDFGMAGSNKQSLVNNLLDQKGGSILHASPDGGGVFLTVYRPVKLFSERYGLMYSVSDDDFIAPIRSKLQIIFISFFLIIGVVIIVFVINLRDIGRNAKELEENRDELAHTLAQQSLLLEHGDSFSYTFDSKGQLVFASENLKKVTGYEQHEWLDKFQEYLAEHPMNSKVDQEMLKQPQEKGIELHYQLEIRAKNGDARILEFREKPFYNHNGEYDSLVGTAKDITEQHKARKNLLRALTMLQAQQETSIDGILVADEDLKVVSCNQRLINMFTMTNAPDMGDSIEPVLDLICDFGKDTSKMESIKAQVIKEPLVEYHEELAMINGRFYEFYSAPIKSRDGLIFGRIWTFRDVTKRKKEIEELVEAKKKAVEGAREKENFLSTMSHEIRTPLNSIVGFANLLLQEDPREDQIEQLKPLKYSADSLLNLINDILDLTKIESGNIDFEKVPFNLKERIEKVRHIFYRNARQKGLSIEAEVDEKIPDALLGDYNRLNQILFNLLGNAIKFTSEGGITLKVGLKGLSDSGAWVRFDIQDTGIGIAEDKLQMIFKSFSQADSNTTRKYGGTGLGLAITKKLVELQGGNISVESEYNVGSTFSFELYFPVVADDEELITEVEENHHSDIVGFKVLLVEDNPFNQRVAEKFLERWGTEITVVDGGEKALQEIKVTQFDVVLMDLQMPGMDGYEATEQIRKMEGEYFQNVPIIAMSADALGDVKEKVAAAGMNDYVSKPFDPNQLLKKIARFNPKIS